VFPKKHAERWYVEVRLSSRPVVVSGVRWGYKTRGLCQPVQAQGCPRKMTAGRATLRARHAPGRYRGMRAGPRMRCVRRYAFTA
jgi:hypothetical protein